MPDIDDHGSQIPALELFSLNSEVARSRDCLETPAFLFSAFDLVLPRPEAGAVLVERPEPSGWLSCKLERLGSSSSRKDMSRVVLGRRVEVLLLEDPKKGCLGVSLIVVACSTPARHSTAWEEAAERIRYAICVDDGCSAS